MKDFFNYITLKCQSIYTQTQILKSYRSKTQTLKVFFYGYVDDYVLNINEFTIIKKKNIYLFLRVCIECLIQE